MAPIVVIENEPESAPGIEPEAVAEIVADAIVEAVEATGEAVADAVEESTDGRAAIDAVLIEEALSVEQRLTALEGRVMTIGEDAWTAKWKVEQLGEVVADLNEEVEDTPEVINDMIEATDVVEDEEGDLHLDAPDEAPPTGQPHWMFKDRKSLWDDIKKAFS